MVEDSITGTDTVAMKEDTQGMRDADSLSDDAIADCYQRSVNRQEGCPLGQETDPTWRQYNDHVWLTVNGQHWAIERIEGHTIYLWRGYAPDLERSILDISNVDWARYIQKAVELLR